MSTVLPGALPLAVNGVRVAASIRPRKFVIEGGDDTPVTMPRTAFQIVYPDCSVMIDSGLDEATHASVIVNNQPSNVVRHTTATRKFPTWPLAARLKLGRAP